jgi:tight adherence protein C
MSALLVSLAVGLTVLSVRPSSVLSNLDGYLVLELPPRQVRTIRLPVLTPVIVIGAVVGAVMLPVSAALGAAIGAGSAGVLQRVRATAAGRRRTERLGQELPAVADLLALYVLSGESVIGALRRFCDEASGVAATEIEEILRQADAGTAFTEAARDAARKSAHRDGGRLYDMLAQAHRSGARLIDSLVMFASDRRAAIERELTAEGGRRALSSYGPILGLMIPTTLLFLMYPTLAGLEALSSTR